MSKTKSKKSSPTDIDLSTITIPSSAILGSGAYSIGATGSTYTTPDYYNITSGTSGASWQDLYTTSASPSSWNIAAADATVKLSNNGINVKESADIKIGDTSLKDFMRQVESRLALLSPNPALEKEWEELKELGDKYRELEQHIKDKMKTWDILKREDDPNK